MAILYLSTRSSARLITTQPTRRSHVHFSFAPEFRRKDCMNSKMTGYVGIALVVVFTCTLVDGQGYGGGVADSQQDLEDALVNINNIFIKSSLITFYVTRSVTLSKNHS